MPARRHSRQGLFAGIAAGCFSLEFVACSLDWDVRLDQAADGEAGKDSDASSDSGDVIDAIVADQQAPDDVIQEADVSANCVALFSNVTATKATAVMCTTLNNPCMKDIADPCGCDTWVTLKTAEPTKAFEKAVADFTQAGCAKPASCTQCSATQFSTCLINGGVQQCTQ